MAEKDFDGFYFLPGDDEFELNLAYFKFKDGEFYGEPVESTNLGHKYHIAFFKRDANGDPMFDDEFEAIFSDPTTYVKGLIGAEIYGCVLRKTESSAKWWEEYLTRAQKVCIINKLKKVTEGILEQKT